MEQRENLIPEKVTFNGQTELCTLIGDVYFLYHPVKAFALMRGKFCIKEEAEKTEPATYLNIRL